MKNKSIKVLFSVLVGIFGIVNFVFADSANITQIVFTTSEQSIDVDTFSAVIAVQTQNTEGVSEQASETVHLLLSSDSETGIFYNANSSACTSELSEPFTLTIASGSANKRFCYIDSTPGTYTLIVSADEENWTSATQSITINSVNTGDEDAGDDSGDEDDGGDDDSGEGEEGDEEESTPVVSFIIRNGDDLLWSGDVYLPADGTVSIIDSNDISHSVDTRSVLAMLAGIDEISKDFEITDLQYYDSFSSFYLRCITPSGDDELCDNWQYAVGATTPFTSIDTTELSGGETVGIYFGYPHQVVLSTINLSTDESLTATAQSYDYENDTWDILGNVSIGVTLPDPENPWIPIVVATYEVDEAGVATVTFDEANTYYLGIAEDFYFPSYEVTVTDPSQDGGDEGSGGGSGGGGGHVITFSIGDAIDYLKSVQDDDGSFADSELYSDWVAIAFGAYGVSGTARTNLISYMETNNDISSFLTDNERRAMAILALGKNPYDFNGVNYIEAILSEFDGDQFGETSLVNDDIFAIFPLSHAGYDSDDTEISNALDFIISKQKTNGSWENSVDVTAAAVQALSIFSNHNGASGAIELANTYLENAQFTNGGFGTVYASAWVLHAESAVSENWTKNGNSIEDYFAEAQEDDGAVLPISDTLANRIWGTAYAVPAMLGMTWNDLLDTVSKPVDNNKEDGDSNDNSHTNQLEDLNINTGEEMSQEEIDRLVAEILRKITEEENNNREFIGTGGSDQVSTENQNSNENNDEPKSDNENIDSENLLASAGNKGEKPSWPIVLISLGGASIIAIVVQKFFFVK